MSKLDPTGESLESILASIRRSLAEQSTDVLAEDGAQPPVSLDTLGSVVPGDDAPPRFIGNAGMEPPRQPEVPPPAGFSVPTDRAFAGLDDPPPPASISAALERRDETPRRPAPAAVPAPSQPEGASKDPLWFLARGNDNKDAVPPPTAAGAPQPAPAQPIPVQAAAPAATAPASNAAPKPTPQQTALKEIVRGPLPPFFGSSPESAKVEVSPAPPTPASLLLPGAAAIPSAAPPPASVARAAEAEPQRSAVPADVALRTPAAPVASPAPPARSSPPVREALPTGRAYSSVPVQSTAGSATPAAATPSSGTAPATNTPHLQGLEAMVADLLRPMLRQWLDENMPRLVSAALKAEAETASSRDPNKP